jgi:hypothetical protein
MNELVLRMTRGTINPATVDAARDLHNAFLAHGSPPGIDVAQALGDVSHAAYRPVDAVTGPDGGGSRSQPRMNANTFHQARKGSPSVRP